VREGGGRGREDSEIDGEGKQRERGVDGEWQRERGRELESGKEIEGECGIEKRVSEAKREIE
jgi:hypothetical protein